MTLDRSLLHDLGTALGERPVVTTLANGKVNRIVQLDEDGALVETEETDRKGRGPQLVPAWMIQTAWDHLSQHGQLTNDHLRNALNVKRSSFVCALLARLPAVEVARTRPITLRVRR